MAAAVLVEEELQNSISMATSEEDAEFEEEDELAMVDDFAANNQLHNGMLEHSDGEEEEDEEDEEEEEEEELILDDDAEGESEEEVPQNEDEEDSDEEDEDGEGVGAVKIQPGNVEDDEEASAGSDEDDEASVASGEDDAESKDSTDAEVEEVWVPEAEEEDEPANPNRCIFCQQDEENDPSEELELYLACDVCGDNAHRQCARNAEALRSDDEAKDWYCPECVANKLVPEHVAAQEEIDSTAARRISRDKIAGDLLPSQRGAVKPDSHSVFNQLITPDDPMDGSRHLRKRKASSADAEEAKVLRSRHREKKGSSAQSTALIEAAHKDNVMDIMRSELDILQPLTNGNSRPSNSRASRALRLKSSSSTSHGTAMILEKSKIQIVVRFTRLDPVELQNILTREPKPLKKKSRPSARARQSVVSSALVPATYSQPFYSLHDREVDELKSKPYGGILTEEEADTTLTLPKPEHRRHFDEARQRAEEERENRKNAAEEAAAVSGIKKPRKISGPASYVEYIEFGPFQIDIWYAAPYPEEYSRNKALFICEFCLKYMESDIVAWRHKTKCPWKHPPGDEIYRDGKISMFEVDGRKNPLYCQNLCLLAKLFLGSKTLYYDVEPFLFYVMTEHDEFGCHFVGYFSKEKRPSSMNNVSCILVLPIHQRKGYGHLLIDFSYLLTRFEKKIGSPEKPLSDMGLVSYRNYWRLVMCYYLRDFNSGDPIPSIRTISNDTGLTPDDVISALDALGALIRDPVTGTYAMKLKTDYYRSVIRQHESKEYTSLNDKALVWTPYIMGRGNANAFEYGPPLNTVAPRDDDAEEVDGPDIISKTSKRDFDTFMSGETNGIRESLERLSTENGDSIHVSTPSEGSSKTNGNSKQLSYYELAASIPATRFEVFPPQAGSRARARPTPNRSRSGVSQSARPAPRRSGGSSRRSSAARPRSATSRRRSGGTGRGPGRWPKGTTKKDFGNAESGPGLPPKLINARSRLGHEVTLGDEEEEQEGEEMEMEEGEEQLEDDEIMYETPAMKKRRDRDLGRGLGKPILEAKARMGKGNGPFINGEDEEMEDVPEVVGDLDIDAEGEDE